MASDLITSDYQIQFNNLLIGSGTPYDIVALLGTGFPVIRAADIDRQGDHGAFVSRKELMGPRTINIEVDVCATDIDDLWDKVNTLKRAFAYGDRVRELTLRFEAAGWGAISSEPITAFGFVRQLTMNLGEGINYNTQKCYIQFFCPDPRMYSATPMTIVVGPQSIIGGWTFPWTFPWTFSSVESGIIDAFNTGFVSTPIIVKFNGPSVNPTLMHGDTGRTMSYAIELPTVDDYLLVDGYAKAVLFNGTASRPDTRVQGSKWIELGPGSNVLQYSHALGTGNAEVTWRSASI